MKTLLIDIETTPNVAHVWGLWQQNVGLNQLIVPTEVQCFAAKWLGERGVDFFSTYHHGKEQMVRAAHELLGQADAVIHYNGITFDNPHLNREFLQAGLTPPAPYKQIDVLKTVQRVFRFPSNKLAYVTKALGLRGKVEHQGHELWIKCMAGDPQAWKVMERYNKRDVTELEKLYNLLQPWIPGHPSHAAHSGQLVCVSCGSDRLERRGFAYTHQSKYQRFQCKQCGRWSRGTKRVEGVQIREVANG